jgi:uncharacterized Zn finger protein (UPF0148 family)
LIVTVFHILLSSFSLQMSKLILEGWTMTAEVCPIPTCHIPLLKNKQNELFCAGCNATLLNESQVPYPATSSSVQTVLHQGSPKSSNQRVERNIEDDYVIVEKPIMPHSPRSISGASNASPNPPVQSTSQKLGAKLLQGWRMLGESCVDCGVPFMQPKPSEPNSNKVFCVQCESWLDSSKVVGEGSGLGEEKPSAQVSPPVPSSSFTHQTINDDENEEEEEEFRNVEKDDADDEPIDREAAALQARIAYEQTKRSLERARLAREIVKEEPLATAASAPRRSGPASEPAWTAALEDVSAGIRRDEAGGPNARTLVSARSQPDNQPASESSSSSSSRWQAPILPVSPSVMFTSVVKQAPRGWESMTTEELTGSVAPGDNSKALMKDNVSSAKKIERISADSLKIEPPSAEQIRRVALALQQGPEESISVQPSPIQPQSDNTAEAISALMSVLAAQNQLIIQLSKSSSPDALDKLAAAADRVAKLAAGLKGLKSL